jgi:hypothetical protein
MCEPQVKRTIFRLVRSSRIISITYAQLQTHHRFSLGHFSSNRRGPEQGARSNASAICYGRYASRHLAFHRLCGRIRSWSPSHYVAEDQE